MSLYLRPFKAEDAEGLLGLEPAACVGVTAEIDGKVAGFGCLHSLGSRIWAVTHLYDERLRRPVLMHRLAMRTLQVLSGPEWRPVFASCDPLRDRAVAWVRALGFLETQEKYFDWLQTIGATTALPASVAGHSLLVWRKD